MTFVLICHCEVIQDQLKRCRVLMEHMDEDVSRLKLLTSIEGLNRPRARATARSMIYYKDTRQLQEK